MTSVFKKIELKAPGIWNRIFGTENKENALAELNNLLAERELLDISENDIIAISRKYKVDFYKRHSAQLKELFSTYLRYCIHDEKISDEELKELQHLKNLLGLTDNEIAEIQNRITGEIYQKSFEESIPDGRLEQYEIDNLKKIRNQLRLPEEIANKISAETRQNFVTRHFQNAISDQRLSEEEWKELEEICKSLHATMDIDDDTKAQLDKFRLYWMIENGDLPVLNPEINLQKNESCYFQAQANWLENRSVTQRVNYGGPAVSIRIMKGVYYRAGSIGVQRITQEKSVLIDTGSVYVTNKRIIFTGESRNTTIALNKVLSLIPYSDGVEIVKASGRNPIFHVVEPDLFAMILSRVLHDSE